MDIYSHKKKGEGSDKPVFAWKRKGRGAGIFSQKGSWDILTRLHWGHRLWSSTLYAHPRYLIINESWNVILVSPLRKMFSPRIHSSLVISPLFRVSKYLKILSIRMSSVILKTLWRNSLKVFLFILSISSVCCRYNSNSTSIADK